MKRTGFSLWAKSVFAATLLVLVALGVVTYRNTSLLLATDRLVSDAYQTQIVIESILSSLRDAANSGRGFLLTGDKQYLTAYDRSVATGKKKLFELHRQMLEDEDFQNQLNELERLAAERLRQLDEAIAVRHALSSEEGLQRVRELMLSDRVRRVEGDISRLFERIQDHQQELLTQREQEAARQAKIAHESIVAGHLLAIGLLALAVVTVRTDRRRRVRAESQLAISEERLSAVLDQVRDAIHICDLEGRVIYWNRGAEQLYGWTSEEASGHPVSNLIVPADEQLGPESSRITSQVGNWSGELRHRAKNGRELLVAERRSLIRDESLTPSAQLVFDVDITERRKLEERQRQSQRLESIGTLAGGIAHDLNNVLTPILMGAKLLARERSEERRRDMAHTMQTAAERGADMIKQLLAFAGGREGRREALEPADVIREVRTILDHTLPKSIEIHVDLMDHMWKVVGDTTELCQLLLNLCINARDAMPNGGHLTIAAENFDVGKSRAQTNPDLAVGRYVMLSVADTGVGMSSDVQEKIFDPFFTTKEQGKGTGLGLATCLGIVRGHGGAIHVYSQEDCGTEFNIYLPAISTERSLAVPASESEVPKGRGELIMMVDDEKIVLDIASAALETNGYRVIAADGGTQAVAVFRQQAQDIQAVIVDWMMPGMDGAATIKSLKEIRPDVRVIISSGFRARMRGSPMLDEACGFLPKPYSDEKLLKLLNQVLNGGVQRPPVAVNIAAF
jgi:two-component system cell cycle sensor histidine kinase/response regulator CckA